MRADLPKRKAGKIVDESGRQYERESTFGNRVRGGWRRLVKLFMAMSAGVAAIAVLVTNLDSIKKAITQQQPPTPTQQPISRVAVETALQRNRGDIERCLKNMGGRQYAYLDFVYSGGGGQPIDIDVFAGESVVDMEDAPEPRIYALSRSGHRRDTARQYLQVNAERKLSVVLPDTNGCILGSIARDFDNLEAQAGFGGLVHRYITDAWNQQENVVAVPSSSPAEENEQDPVAASFEICSGTWAYVQDRVNGMIWVGSLDVNYKDEVSFHGEARFDQKVHPGEMFDNSKSTHHQVLKGRIYSEGNRVVVNLNKVRRARVYLLPDGRTAAPEQEYIATVQDWPAGCSEMKGKFVQTNSDGTKEAEVMFWLREVTQNDSLF